MPKKAWLLLVPLAALYWTSRGAYFVGFFNDDAFYIIGARSLLTGRFAELNVPGAPPMDTHSPGFPLLLLPAALAAGEGFAAYQATAVLLSVAGVWLLTRFGRERLAPETALAAAAAAALNPLAVGTSATVLSEIAYVPLSLLILLLASRAWPKNSPGVWAGLGALAGYLGLVRLSGASLLAALVAGLAWERRWKCSAVCAGAGSGVLGAWILRNFMVAGRSETRVGEMLETLGWSGEMLGRIPYYTKEAFGRALFRWPAMLGTNMGTELWTAAAALAGLAAVVEGLRRWGWAGAGKVLPLYLGAYGLVHLAWPYQSARYLHQVLPLAALLTFAGIEKFGKRAALAAGFLSVALSAAPVSAIVRASLGQTRNPMNTAPTRSRDWIRRNTPPEAVFAASLDGQVHLLTGRPCLHLPGVDEPAAMKEWLERNKVSFVAEFPNDFFMKRDFGSRRLDPPGTEKLERILAAAGGREIFRDPDEGVRIFQVR